MSQEKTSLVEKVQVLGEAAYERVDPYLPQVAKDTISYAQKTAQPFVGATVAYTQQTINGTVNYVSKVKNDSLEYGKKTINGTVDYGKKTINGTVDYGKKTINGTVEYATQTITGAKEYAQKQTNQALEFGKVTITGATTTITAHTPGPILQLIQTTVDASAKLAADPVGTVKPYVPSFVIHFGEKSYEIVGTVQEQSMEGIKAASGFIVTKVNGITQSVTSVPIVAQIIDRLNSVTAPIIAKFTPAAVTKTAAAAEEQVSAPIATAAEP